jgi:hypothetical protein
MAIFDSCAISDFNLRKSKLFWPTPITLVRRDTALAEPLGVHSTVPQSTRSLLPETLKSCCRVAVELPDILARVQMHPIYGQLAARKSGVNKMSARPWPFRARSCRKSEKMLTFVRCIGYESGSKSIHTPVRKQSTSSSAFFNLRALIIVLLCAAAAYWILTAPLLAFFRSEGHVTVSQRMLTFEERVSYQRAITLRRQCP